MEVDKQEKNNYKKKTDRCFKEKGTKKKKEMETKREKRKCLMKRDMKENKKK